MSDLLAEKFFQTVPLPNVDMAGDPHGKEEAGTEKAVTRWLERLPPILVFGTPVFAAAVTISVVLATSHFGYPDALAPVLKFLIPAQAMLSVIGPAVGGLLVREVLLLRLLYALAAGLCGIIAYAVTCMVLLCAGMFAVSLIL